jgi:hypothetical protein
LSSDAEYASFSGLNRFDWAIGWRKELTDYIVDDHEFLVWFPNLHLPSDTLNIK